MTGFLIPALFLMHDLRPLTTPSNVYYDQIAVIRTMVPDVDVTLVVCGQMNGFFRPWSDDIVLCTEASENPGMALFIAAHEAGHAMLQAAGLDNTEAAADKLGIYGLLQFGDVGRDALLDAAMWFQSQGDGDYDPTERHPRNSERAWTLACAEAGSEAPGTTCAKFYTRIMFDGAKVADAVDAK